MARDGDTGLKFHEKCDNKEGGILVLYHTDENIIFDGFSNAKWISYSNPEKKSAGQNFSGDITAKRLTKEINSSKVARWTEKTYKSVFARNYLKKLGDKYNIFINKTALYQLKTILSNWLKLRDMDENLRNRFTKIGTDQHTEGVEFKKILILMKSLASHPMFFKVY